MRYETITITPEMAGNFLEDAIDNRPISQGHVHTLAKDMKEGRWRLTHQGIAFNQQGKLVDGQHRLWAIIESGVSITMPVANGLSPESLDGVDCGRKRTFTDYEVLSGNKITKAHESTLRAMFYIGNPNKHLTVSNLRELWITHNEAVSYIMKLFVSSSGPNHSFQRGTNTAAIRAVVCRASYTQAHQRLEEFVMVLRTGLMKSPQDEAAVKLRNILLSTNPATIGRRLAFEPSYRKTERALDSFLKYQALKKIYESDEELFPIPGEINFLKNQIKPTPTNSEIRSLMHG